MTRQSQSVALTYEISTLAYHKNTSNGVQELNSRQVTFLFASCQSRQSRKPSTRMVARNHYFLHAANKTSTHRHGCSIQPTIGQRCASALRRRRRRTGGIRQHGHGPARVHLNRIKLLILIANSVESRLGTTRYYLEASEQFRLAPILYANIDIDQQALNELHADLDELHQTMLEEEAAAAAAAEDPAMSTPDAPQGFTDSYG